MWSQPIGLHLFVNTDKARIAFRLYLITPVQSGEDGNARPLSTVGGKRVQPKAPPLRRAACGYTFQFSGCGARAPASDKALRCCWCYGATALILSSAGRTNCKGRRKTTAGALRTDSWRITCLLYAHPAPTPGQC